MADLASRLSDHLRETRLFPEPGLALLAVSGGPDSVAMLELLHAIAPEMSLTLAVAHVDHGIAAGSEDVAEQVLALAVRKKVRGYLRHVSLGPDSSETRAREERYRLLREVQEEVGARYLVTAHHADDQIETTLLRFLRGSAPAGLAGIQPTGPDGLIRPLLPFRRSELSDWLSTHHAPRTTRPVVDPANSDSRHDRSWLRTEIFPLLRERFERLDQNLLDGQSHAARDRQAWAQLLRVLPGLDLRVGDATADVARTPLRAYDKALSEGLLRAVAREAGCVIGPGRARKLAELAETGSSGRVVQLGEGWEAELVFDRLRIARHVTHESPGAAGWGQGEAGSVSWGRWEISWHPEPAGVSPRGGFTTWISQGPGEVRSPRGGDQLVPLGGVGHRSVHRLLMEARVPRSERVEYPVLVRDGEPLWLPGVCRAAAAVPEPGRAALRIDARHA